MGKELDRLIQKGDIVIFMPPNGNVKAVKNLTIGQEYFVEEVYVRDTEWFSGSSQGLRPTDGYSRPCTPHVDTVYVINDKGLKFSYSAKHFLIAKDGVHFSMERVEQLNRQEFLDGLRDL